MPPLRYLASFQLLSHKAPYPHQHTPTHLQVLPPQPLQRLHPLRLAHQRPLSSSSPLPRLSQCSCSCSGRILGC